MTNKEAIKILSHTTNLGYGVVIEAMEGYTTREIKMALDKSIKALEEERPQGEWITDNWGMVHCNYCMREKQQLFNNFCSYCGAEMQKGDNDGLSLQKDDRNS